MVQNQTSIVESNWIFSKFYLYMCVCVWVGLYGHHPLSMKPARAKLIHPSQTSTASVRHDGRQRYSSTEVGRYSCRRRIFDSDEHCTTPICLYIYTKLKISTPFKSDLRFPSPPTTQNPPPFQLFIFKHLCFCCHPGQIFKLLSLPPLPGG